MGLISIKGLNCYESCVINIAGRLGIEYLLSFSNLWSESDLMYDEKYSIYTSRRMTKNLDQLGLKIEKAACSTPDQAEMIMGSTRNGAFIIIGMDAFYLPWSPIYQLSHDAHYFYAHYGNTYLLSCCDPSYGEAQVSFPRSEVTARAFELCRVKPSKITPFTVDERHEVEMVVRTHPKTRDRILLQMEDTEHLLLLGRYIDALINNRYLYRYYLSVQQAPLSTQQLFDDDFFMEWKSVKNGLIKAYLLKKNKNIISQTKTVFCNLMDRELEMAGVLI